jgi:hypothetical protein
MDTDLIKTRVISFVYEAGTLIALAIISALSSADMKEVITEHFGAGIAGTFAVLVLTGIVKQIRNVRVLKERSLGGIREGSIEPITLI